METTRSERGASHACMKYYHALYRLDSEELIIVGACFAGVHLGKMYFTTFLQINPISILPNTFFVFFIFYFPHRHTVHVQVLFPGWDELKWESTVCGEPYVIVCGTLEMPACSVGRLAMVQQRVSCTEQQMEEEWVPFTSPNLSMIDVLQFVSYIASMNLVVNQWRI